MIHTTRGNWNGNINPLLGKEHGVISVIRNYRALQERRSREPLRIRHG